MNLTHEIMAEHLCIQCKDVEVENEDDVCEGCIENDPHCVCGNIVSRRGQLCFECRNE